eukprot:2393577-Rhodomonas_salina.1
MHNIVGILVGSGSGTNTTPSCSVLIVGIEGGPGSRRWVPGATRGKTVEGTAAGAGALRLFLKAVLLFMEAVQPFVGAF